MFTYSGFDHAKKAGLFVFLLTQAMFLQAAQPPVAQSTSAESTTAEAAADAGRKQQRSHFFPRWPERRRVQQERVPPPPPGPYMSSALSGSSVNGPSFERIDRPVMKLETSRTPTAAFSPDIPWPSNTKSPERWVPESGYNYVQPAVKSRPYAAMPRNYNYGHPMNYWPGSRSGSQPYAGPSVRMNPGRPYPATQYRQPANRAP